MSYKLISLFFHDKSKKWHMITTFFNTLENARAFAQSNPLDEEPLWIWDSDNNIQAIRR